MTSVIDFIAEPMQFGFMQNALIIALFVSVVCALLSAFLVIKGWALMGDAVSHAVLPGIVIAEVIALPYSIGAFFSGLLCALLTGYIKSNSRLKEDTVMGIVFAGMFAIGILLVTQVESEQHLMHVIQGNLLGIEKSVFVETIVICSIVIVAMVLKWKDFMLYCFDYGHARVSGLLPQRLHYLLLVFLALTIVGSIQAVGVILVVAILIAPGITGHLLARSFRWVMVVSVMVAILAAIIGVYVSFYLDASTAACIVLVQSLFVIMALMFKSIRRAIIN